MMQSTTSQAAGRPYPVFDTAFEDFTNERLYDALCAATAPLDAGLKELQLRLKPIILNAARGYLNAFSWTFDNAMGEALILIWELVRKHSYKAGIVPFHNFFSKVWSIKLKDIFTKLVIKTPVPLGDIQTGWSMHQPVFCCSYGFHPKATEYRERKAAQQAAWYDKKLASEGKTRQPKKPPMTAEERQEKARLKARARYDAMTPEERRAMYDKNNARRKAARDAETPEQKAARRAHAAELARARRSAQK